jgi:hypothetical protein
MVSDRANPMTLPPDIERLIERSVVLGTALPRDERSRLEALLDGSAEARALHAAFERLYLEFAEEEGGGSREVDAFVDMLGLDAPPVAEPVTLRPVPRLVHYGPTVLAAKSASQDRSRFEPLAVLGDPQRSVVFRLLADREAGEILAFRIGRSFGPSVLQLARLGADVAIGSDGRGRMPTPGVAPDWDREEVVWHPAAVVLQLGGPGERAANGYGVAVRERDGALSLEARGVAGSLVVEHPGGVFTVTPDVDGRVTDLAVDLAFPASFGFCP